jgi:hypothetical protein
METVLSGLARGTLAEHRRSAGRLDEGVEVDVRSPRRVRITRA